MGARDGQLATPAPNPYPHAMAGSVSFEALASMTEALKRAASGERVPITSGGEIRAALVPVEDLRRLEAMDAEEDRLDVDDAEQALKAFQESGEPPVPWEQIKHELGLS